MFTTFLQILVIVIILMFIIAIYRYNKAQVEKKKKVIETFNEHLDHRYKNYNEEDYVVYSKIIGIFKHKLGKPPTADQMFRCFDKIKSNELTYKKLRRALHEHGDDYETYLFPELKYLEADVHYKHTPDITADGRHLEYEDAVLIKDHKKEKPMKIRDDIENQYVIHRPTIYNINNKIVGDQEFDTERFLRAIRKTVGELDTYRPIDMDEDYVYDDYYENGPVSRCGTLEEINAERLYSDKKHNRDMQELEMGCKSDKNKKKLAKQFDKIVHNNPSKASQCKKDSKKKCPVEPVQVRTDLEAATLEDSKNTQVGSILSKFSYKEDLHPHQ